MAVVIPFPRVRTPDAGRDAFGFFPGRDPDAPAGAEAPFLKPTESARQRIERQGRAKAACRRSMDAPAEAEERCALLARVHIARKDLTSRLPHFNDQTYRFVLECNFGVRSAKDCTDEQLKSLLLHFQGLGFKDAYTRPAAYAATPRLRKIEALLAKLRAATAFPDRRKIGWPYAAAILKRQTGGAVTDLSQADGKQLEGVIAALSRSLNNRIKA